MLVEIHDRPGQGQIESVIRGFNRCRRGEQVPGVANPLPIQEFRIANQCPILGEDRVAWCGSRGNPDGNELERGSGRVDGNYELARRVGQRVGGMVRALRGPRGPDDSVPPLQAFGQHEGAFLVTPECVLPAHGAGPRVLKGGVETANDAQRPEGTDLEEHEQARAIQRSENVLSNREGRV